jgi:hypothetical protein
MRDASKQKATVSLGGKTTIITVELGKAEGENMVLELVKQGYTAEQIKAKLQ